MAISKEFIAHVKPPPRNLITILLYSAGIFFILKSFTSIELTSLWNDELSTAEKSFQDSIDYLYNYLARDTHPPFYYLVMMFAGQVFGKTFLTLRGLSWFSYFGSCFIANLVIREQKLRQPYPAAMFLLTASTPFAFRYSSEGKAYSMIMLVIMLFLLFRTEELLPLLDRHVRNLQSILLILRGILHLHFLVAYKQHHVYLLH